MRIQRNPRSRQGARLAAEIGGQSASEATPRPPPDQPGDPQHLGRL